MVSVAIDIQGADAARPYVKKAGVKYTALVDENNVLGKLFGVNYVPLHYIIDEFGIYRMKERDPQKIADFLNQEKVDMSLVVKASDAPGMYDVKRLKEIVEWDPYSFLRGDMGPHHVAGSPVRGVMNDSPHHGRITPCKETLYIAYFDDHRRSSKNHLGCSPKPGKPRYPPHRG